MKFVSAYCSDRGLVKKVNQDSMLLLHAQSAEKGEIVFALVCDGVGGLNKGELASSTVVHVFARWFREYLPALCTQSCPAETIFADWAQLIQRLHEHLRTDAEAAGLRLGTTVEALLLMDGSYYICHVGDCRVYLLEDGALCQLTRDQSFVQQEMDAGRMTEEQARHDPRQNLLLQCVGAGREVKPVFLTGALAPGQAFLVCCDGFRRRITEAEIARAVAHGCRGRQAGMDAALARLTDACKKRREPDNITSILVCSAEEKRRAGLLKPLKRATPGPGFAITKSVLLACADEAPEFPRGQADGAAGSN